MHWRCARPDELAREKVVMHIGPNQTSLNKNTRIVYSYAPAYVRQSANQSTRRQDAGLHPVLL